MIILQLVLVAGIAPLASGVITKIKNNLRMRRGPGMLQPYHNLAKLCSKDEVISVHASWIFRVTPYIVFSSCIIASALVPVLYAQSALARMGDLFALVFVLSAGRFFLALSGLDTGSAFGGMGSSREMFVSSFAEPVVVLSFFTIALQAGTSDLTALTSVGAIKLSTVLSALAIFLVILAETSRIPVDNQETHLELTMIHEAMVLEYSGRSLALIEMASYIKQIVLFALVANLVVPFVPATVTCGSLGAALFAFVAKIFFIAIVVAFIEVALAKMRLFRAVDFLSFAFVLALISLVVAGMGV